MHGANRGTEAREDKWPMLYAWNLGGRDVKDSEMKVGHDAPVDVLFRAHGLGDEALALRSDVLAERELDEDAADVHVVVELLDSRDDLVDGAAGGERDVVELDPDLLGRLCLHADIDGRVGTLASLHDGELGLKPRVFRLERADTGGDTIANCPKNRVRETRAKEWIRTNFATSVPSIIVAADMVVRAKTRLAKKGAPRS